MRKNGPAARFAAVPECEKKTKSHVRRRQRAWLFSYQKLLTELLRGFEHYRENGGTIVKIPIILTVNNRFTDKNTVI
jgi:hypothetical protein